VYLVRKGGIYNFVKHVFDIFVGMHSWYKMIPNDRRATL
jgi:hypothetical protein